MNKNPDPSLPDPIAVKLQPSKMTADECLRKWYWFSNRRENDHIGPTGVERPSSGEYEPNEALDASAIVETCFSEWHKMHKASRSCRDLVKFVYGEDKPPEEFRVFAPGHGSEAILQGLDMSCAKISWRAFQKFFRLVECELERLGRLKPE